MKRYISFILITDIIFSLAFSMSDFYDSHCSTLSDFMMQSMLWGLVAAANMLFIWLLSINKYVYAVVFPITTLFVSATAYFRYTMKITMTQMTVDLILTNDLTTSMDLVTLPLILFVLSSVALATYSAYIRFSHIPSPHRGILQASACALLLIIALNNSKTENAIKYRVPFNIYASISTYIADQRTISDNRPQFNGTATCQTDSIDVVFILGETLRAKNMQINGYGRHTTPYLMKEQNIVSYPNIYTHYFYTFLSVPYILTRASPSHEERADNERSFIDIFKKSGFNTTWIANQESVNTFIYFMKEANSLIYVNGGKSLYIYDKWLDGDVLPALDSIITSPRKSPRTLTVIHTIGSHWWYKAHYPDSMAHWKPDLQSRVIQENTIEQMRNSYDNTVLYSDFFWQQVRNRLKDKNAIVIYLADHGENLGENGFVTHGNDTEYVHNPGCWIWYSDKYKQNYPDKVAALLRNKNNKYDTAFLFNSIIDGADIRTKYIDNKYDIFK